MVDLSWLSDHAPVRCIALVAGVAVYAFTRSKGSVPIKAPAPVSTPVKEVHPVEVAPKQEAPKPDGIILTEKELDKHPD